MFPRHQSQRGYARIVRSYVALVCLLLLGGCQSMELSQQELSWQALHAMDIAQTLSAADDPCYQEDAWLTQKLIGKQPSDVEVLAWGIGTAIGHMMVSHTLDVMNAPQWLQKAFSYGTLSYTGYTVANNYDEGVRAFGDNKDVSGCYL